MLLWLADVAQLYVSNDSLELTVRANTGPGSQVNAKTTVTLSSRLVGRWMHVAGTFDGRKWRLYRDGAEVAACGDLDGLQGTGCSDADAEWCVHDLP